MSLCKGGHLLKLPQGKFRDFPGRCAPLGLRLRVSGFSPFSALGRSQAFGLLRVLEFEDSGFFGVFRVF